MALLASLWLKLAQKGMVLSRHAGCVLRTSQAGYAKKIGVGTGKGVASISQKEELEVEEDAEKLVKFCCGANIYTTGQDPELRPDSEYPDWLWTLRTQKNAPDLSELDPDTYYYWGRLRKMHRRRISQLMKSKKIK